MRWFVGLIAKLLIWILALILGLALVLVLLATAGWLKAFNDSVTLPNGMMLRREFNFTRIGSQDMFLADGRTALAREIEFVCFNDRYVFVYSYQRKYSGLYDGETGSAVRAPSREEYDEIKRDSGLRGGNGCNGYYTGVVGPGLLYDGNRAPFLPPCAWRNEKNPSLADRSWFERPCLE